MQLSTRTATFILLACCPSWAGPAATATKLTVTPSTITLGKTPNPVRLSAAVTNTNGTKVTTPGTVQFCNATASTCIGQFLIAQAQLTPAGTASVNVFFSAGIHSIKAIYSGTTQYGASVSSVQSVTVQGTPTVTTMAASVVGNQVSLAASVHGGSSLPLTGGVTFSKLVSGKPVALGTATLTGSTKSFNFAGGLSFPSNGIAPEAATAGDFNNDGFTDLAFVNLYTNNLEVLSVSGGANTQISLTGSGPSAITAADFNSDGNLDLAIANAESNSVAIYLGNGDLTFTYAGAFDTGGIDPSSLTAADFNHDGIPDLAVTNQLSSTVTVFQGTGTGQFTLVAQAPTDVYPYSVVAGDFNSDGNADLAVANYFGFDVTVLTGNGQFGFHQAALQATGVYPDSIVAGDFNRDGKLDLAVANQFSGTVTILLGNGDATFTPESASPTVGSNPGAITTMDLNQDGIADLAVASFGSNTVTTLLGKGDGTFSNFGQVPLVTGSTPHAITMGDFAGAGVPDLAIADSGNNSITVLLNDAGTDASATLGKITLPGGPYTIVAQYNGTTGYGSSTAQTSFVITPIPTATALAASQNMVAVLQSFTLTATISPTPVSNFVATGTVAFYNGSTLLGQGTVVNGHVQATVAIATAGIAAVTARYNGDKNFVASTSSAITIYVFTGG